MNERVNPFADHKVPMQQVVDQARIPLCITNPREASNPIIYANKAFCDLTEYNYEEFIGHNCKFLQGENTSPESILTIREILSNRDTGLVEIINYKKSGQKFINSLQVGPIFSKDGTLEYFFGSQLDVTTKRDDEARIRSLANKELVHRLKNIVNVMTSIMRMSARHADGVEDLTSKMLGRLHAISEVNFDLLGEHENINVRAFDLTRKIVNAYAYDLNDQLVIGGEDVYFDARIATSVALTIHELAINSVKYGALSVDAGNVNVEWSFSPQDDRYVILQWRETNGPTVLSPERQGGSSILKKILNASGGDIEFQWRPDGVIVKASFPHS